MTERPLVRVAVTGVGMVTSVGHDATETFRRLVAGERGIGARRDELGLALPPLPVAEVYAERLLAAGVGPGSKGDCMALQAAREALAQAALGDVGLEVVLGATTGAAREAILDYAQAAPEDLDVLVRRLALEPLEAAANRIREALPQVKSATVVCAACASGALAIALGAMRLEQGATAAQLVGGTDALNALTLSGFSSLGALSSEPCRPFDAQRNGLTLGEGAALLVLETESMVRARGGKVLAWLDGYALGAEAHHLTHPEPEGRRATELMREAMRCAGLSPEDIGYVNAHGTATVPNDAMESKAIAVALGERVRHVYVSSSKGQLGHTLGAAGAIEAAIVIQSLEAQSVVPTMGLDAPDADTAPLRHVRGQGQPHAFSAALSTSFGFGGIGAVLALSHVARANHRTRARAGESSRVFVTGTVTLTAAGLRSGCANAVLIGSNDAPSAGATLPFDPLERLVMERSRRFDRLSALSTLGVTEVLADTGLVPAEVGLVVGNALGNVGRTAEFIRRVRARGVRGAQPAEFPHLLSSAASGNASIYAGLEGPVFNVAALEGSAESAVELAALCLRSGSARAMVVGTAEMADEAVLAARATMDEARAARVRSADGAAFLLLETESAVQGRKGPLCALEWFAPLRTSDMERFSSTPGERAELFTVGMDDDSLGLALRGWALGGIARRALSAQVGQGWAGAAAGFAVAAARVLAGEADVAMVLSEPPTGVHLAVFRRVSA